MSLIKLPGVAFISGGGSGMGRATAIIFAKAGATLVLVDVNTAGLQETAELIKKDTPEAKVKVVTLDIRKDEEVIKLIQSIPVEFGRLDYALNCAGVLGKVRAPFAESITEDDDFIMNINSRAQAILIREQLKVMLKQEPLPDGTANPQKGIIVNWGSWVSNHSSKTSWAYAASKASILSQTQSVANAHAVDLIRCNAVLPGMVMTGLYSSISADKAQEWGDKMKALTPANRMGLSEEIANVALFLCSPLASYVNGVGLPVDGGWDAL